MGWGALIAAGLQTGGSLLSGKTEGASEGEQAMLGRTRELMGTADGLRGHEESRIRDLADLSDERHAMVGRGVTGVNQAIGGAPPVLANRTGTTDFQRRVLDQNTMRGKALVRVAQAGDQAVEQKGLMDRMKYLSLGLNKARMAQGLGVAQIQSEAGQRQDGRLVRDAMIDAGGNAAVFGAGYFEDYLANRPRPNASSPRTAGFDMYGEGG